MSIFLTPFSEYYFTTFILTSIFFTVEVLGISQYIDGANAQSGQPLLLIIIIWVVLMFLATYSVRHVLTEFYVTKKGAEKTRDALTQTLDNLPDAVLMFEMDDLSYCN
jgi:succinate dehydrogenase/fumarate reductase cytochrome b subunit